MPEFSACFCQFFQRFGLPCFTGVAGGGNDRVAFVRIHKNGRIQQLCFVLRWNDQKPMLSVPSGLDYLPLVIAGVLVVLFTIEHVIALLQGKEVEPAWN